MKKPVVYLSFANDITLPALDEERKEIKRIFEDKNFHVEHESSTNLNDIFETFNTYRGRIGIMHFAGHANFSGLQLKDSNIKNITLQSLLELELQTNMKSLGVVFWNGCNTWGLVEGLIKIGVTCVIATSKSIRDKEAKDFAKYFYKSLLENQSIENAYKFAKANLNLENQSVFLK